MSGRETSESLLPPRPQKSFPLSWTAAVVIFHSENSSFSVRTFDFNLSPPSLLTAVGLFLLRCSVQIVRIAVNPWKQSLVLKRATTTFVIWDCLDTHWQHLRFASIRFSPAQQERWSQTLMMQPERKTLSRFPLQQIHREHVSGPVWKLLLGDFIFKQT